MSYFLKSGNTFRVSTKEAMDLHETLPAGNYVVKEMPMDGPLYLEHIESFEIKGKRYGDLDKNTDRILNTFMDRSASTGVMLAGEKGSGKSLLAKNLAIEAAKRFEIPCLSYEFGKDPERQNRLTLSQVLVAHQSREPDFDLAPAPPGYTLVNLGFSKKIQLFQHDFSVGVQVNNLLNTEFKEYMNRFRYFTADMGRNFQLKLNYQF